MANQVVSQMEQEEKELEELKKAYEEKKKEFVNKKRAYTRLVNQTEDMKKELEGLYESLENGSYRKTERFDSTIYDKIAELEEAIRVNDEKLGREKITYTETAETKTVSVEAPVIESPVVPEENLLSDAAKDELKARFAILANMEESLKGFREAGEKDGIGKKEKSQYALAYNILWKTRSNMIKEMCDEFPEASRIVNEEKITDSDKIREALGIEAANIEDFNENEKEWVSRAISVRIMEAGENWQAHYIQKRDEKATTLQAQQDDLVKDTIEQIQDLVHSQVKMEFQCIGLDPALYLDSEEEINEARIPLNDEQKAMNEAASETVMAVLDNVENPTYESVRNEFIKQIDIEKDTFKDETYAKIQDLKDKLDVVLEGRDDEDANLRKRFKQKRAERQLAKELGIKRKDLGVYQKAIDDIYDEYNGQGEYGKETYRTFDLDKLVLVSDVLQIEDDEIDRFDTVNQISSRAHKLLAYEKYVDSMETAKHIEDSKEKLSDLVMIEVVPKNNDYDWSMIDMSTIDTADIERLDRLGLEVYDLLDEIYVGYEEENAEIEREVKVNEVKAEKAVEMVDEATNNLVKAYEVLFDMQSEEEETEEAEAEAESEEESEDDLNL